MKVEYHGDEIFVSDVEGQHVLTFVDWGPDGCGEDHYFSAHTPDGRYRLHEIDGDGYRWVDFDAIGDGEEVDSDWEGMNPPVWIYPMDLLTWTAELINGYLPVDAENSVSPLVIGGAE